MVMRHGNAEAGTRQRGGDDREPTITDRQPMAMEGPAGNRSRQRRQAGSREVVREPRGANAMLNVSGLCRARTTGSRVRSEQSGEPLLSHTPV